MVRVRVEPVPPEAAGRAMVCLAAGVAGLAAVRSEAEPSQGLAAPAAFGPHRAVLGVDPTGQVGLETEVRASVASGEGLAVQGALAEAREVVGDGIEPPGSVSGRGGPTWQSRPGGLHHRGSLNLFLLSLSGGGQSHLRPPADGGASSERSGLEVCFQGAFQLWELLLWPLPAPPAQTF